MQSGSEDDDGDGARAPAPKKPDDVLFLNYNVEGALRQFVYTLD